MGIAIVLWLLAVFAGSMIGIRKNRIGWGLALSVLLSWVGVLILAFIPRKPLPGIRYHDEDMLNR